MLEGLSGGCRAGLTLERGSQLHAFALQSVSLDATVVLLVEDGVPQVHASSELQSGALREGVARGKQGPLSRRAS